MKRLNLFFMAMVICTTYPVYAESLPKPLPLKVALQGSHSFALSKPSVGGNPSSPLVDNITNTMLLQQASGEPLLTSPADTAIEKKAATKSSYQSRQRRFYLKLLMFVGAKSEANQ